MSNFFDSALNDLKSLEKDVLGPDYPYHKYIKTPKELGMSSAGNKIGTNIGSMVAYTEVLSTGRGAASATGKPLGDKFFMKTGAKCKDKKTGKQVSRSIYINNVPDGNIPFISSITGANFTDLEGLIPGTMSDMNNLNPLAIFQAFMIGNNPECRALSMETIDENNKKSKETAFVLTSDLKNMNACWFPNKKNPVTGEKCREAFSKIKNISDMPDNTVDKIYYGSVALLFFYIFMKVFEKKR